MEYEESNLLPPEYQGLEQDYDITSYFSNDNDTGDSSSITTFYNKRSGKFNQSNKKLDNGSYIFNRMIDDVRVKIPCFATKSIRDTKIRCATTGIYHSFYVGKSDENLFFKVRFVNGETGSSKYGNDFYYNSPEEYERHLFTKIPQKIKDAWLEKYQTEKQRRILASGRKSRGLESSPEVTIVK